jgi:UDP-N-acetylmuramyl pentapeptide phosphotransferase/UDP-N-acetylglucosamine-1-phosphate transferase
MTRYAFNFCLVYLTNLRSSHVMPTPRGGGIGILLGVVLTVMMAIDPGF